MGGEYRMTFSSLIAQRNQTPEDDRLEILCGRLHEYEDKEDKELRDWD